MNSLGKQHLESGPGECGAEALLLAHCSQGCKDNASRWGEGGSVPDLTVCLRWGGVGAAGRVGSSGEGLELMEGDR